MKKIIILLSLLLGGINLAYAAKEKRYYYNYEDFFLDNGKQIVLGALISDTKEVGKGKHAITTNYLGQEKNPNGFPSPAVDVFLPRRMKTIYIRSQEELRGDASLINRRTLADGTTFYYYKVNVDVNTRVRTLDNTMREGAALYHSKLGGSGHYRPVNQLNFFLRPKRSK